MWKEIAKTDIKLVENYRTNSKILTFTLKRKHALPRDQKDVDKEFKSWKLSLNLIHIGKTEALCWAHECNNDLKKNAAGTIGILKFNTFFEVL